MFEQLMSSNKNFAALPQSEDFELEALEARRQLKYSTRSRFCTIPLFNITTLISAVVGAWIGSGHFTGLDRFCMMRISQYSPLMPDVNMKYEFVQFNGSLFMENVYRQDGGQEVDAAWEALGVDYRAVIVPTSLAAKSGLTTGQVQVSPKYGGGFPANVEGLHHLHCLNLLRKALYYNIEYYHDLGQGAFKNDERILKYHVSHCLDTLRQELMCSVDVGVLGQVWWNREEPTAFPDFNTEHKCRNFEDVRSWAEAHQAPADVPADYLIKPGSMDKVHEHIP